MKRLVLALALAATASSAFADPLSDALGSGDGLICFTRTYDAAWLKAHRGQTVREVRFAVTQNKDWRTLRMSLRGAGGPLYLFGECAWYEGDLNRGGQHNILDPGFKPTSGVGCMLYTDVAAGSAEEGGDFPVEWGGGKYIQVHLPDSLAAWRSHNVRRYAGWIKMRPADRVVRLDRAPASACRALVTRFAPGQPR